MRGKANQNQDEEEYEEEDFSSKRDGPSSSFTHNHNNSVSTNSNRDGKSSDKASAIRSKHSVTEQRRRSKINERFQILRELIPHSDQKRDTASFLLEVIEYVQHLQEKVQKFEGPYQGWSSEPTKLMPWRNSHWRVQNFGGQSQAVKNGSGPGSTFPGKFDENNIAVKPNVFTSPQNPVQSEPSRDMSCKRMEEQSELANKVLPFPMHMQTIIPSSVRSDGVVGHPLQRPLSDDQSGDFPMTGDVLNQHGDLTVESGTITISSVYSQGVYLHFTYLDPIETEDSSSLRRRMHHIRRSHCTRGIPPVSGGFQPFTFALSICGRERRGGKAFVVKAAEQLDTSTAEYWCRFISGQHLSAN